MGMVVQHNMNALNAYNKLNANVAGLRKASEKLSSGYRINRAGDDAAGLAISEKMRSQIRGLNQAVRNSQDGINMIQTFEGAAQETHSILQRMKELASESANGTYDNATDRAAIQLEFDQLNDELNQIADTDFNGTIVLNGGEMSDGLKQVDGEFNYVKNKESSIIDSANSKLKELTADALDKYNVAYKEYASKNYDLSAGGDADEWNTLDARGYDKDVADKLWVKLGITKVGDDTVADASRINQVAVTFKLAEDGTWKADSAVDNLGNKLADDKVALFETVNADYTSTTNTGKGGFVVKVDTVNAAAPNGQASTNLELGNAVFDSVNAKAGDTVTLVYSNGPAEKYAPSNFGIDQDTFKVTDAAGTGSAVALDKTESTLKVEVVAKDADMDADMAKAFEALEGVSFEATFDDTQYFAANNVTLGGVDISQATSAATTSVALGDVAVYVKSDATTAGQGKIFSVYADQAGTKELFKITVPEDDATATTGNNGKVSATFHFSESNYSESSNIKVSVGANESLGTSKVEYANLNATKEAYNKLASQSAFTDYKKAKDYLTANGVSISDSFDNSTARLTYTDNITLQTGSRTKDSVNFSFKYNTDGTADMGELKANLNLSARADGLNTANLSLANQKDANYAIDQIDKAINKTSMVRATFGSIQNRLEHKITNLTTTSENLTEAESSIRDTDMASEMMNYTKFNILQQAAQSMLAQANQQPQSILQLLG